MKADTVEQIDNSFVEMISKLRKGKISDKASAKLAQVLEAVKKTGRKGKLTLTCTIQLTKDGERVIIDTEINAKVPEMAEPASIFFVDEQNRLHRNDPNQKDLPFNVVEGKQQEQEDDADASAAASN